MSSSNCLGCFLLLLIVTSGYCRRLRREVESEGRIVGGSPANIEELPYQVSIQVENVGEYVPICGGSIYSNTTILTSASCLHTEGVLQNSNKLSILVGTSNSKNTYDDGRRYKISSIIIHEGFMMNLSLIHHNIAIIRVSDVIEFNNKTRNIPIRRYKSHTGENCVVSGWGDHAYNGPTNETLMKAVVPIFNPLRCRQLYGNIIDNYTICAGFMNGEKDACQGDGGGPLVCSGELAGIVSFGNECGKDGYPGVYTEVSAYYQWIRESSANTHKISMFLISFITLLCILF